MSATVSRAYGAPGTNRRFLYIAKYLAVQDIKSRFRRSAFGSLWIVINQLVYSFGVGFVWSRIFGLEMKEFVPFISVSFAMWAFLASSFVDGCNTFVHATSYLKQIKVPLGVFTLRTVLAQSVFALTGFATAVAVNVMYDVGTLVGVLYAIPGLILLTLFSLAVTRMMAFAGVRFRDLPHAMGNVFQLLFVLTPVIYPPQVLEERGLGGFVKYNPLASILDVVRTPITDQQFAGTSSYVLAIAFTLLCAGVGHMLSVRWTRTVPFWL